MDVWIKKKEKKAKVRVLKGEEVEEEEGGTKFVSPLPDSGEEGREADDCFQLTSNHHS